MLSKITFRLTRTPAAFRRIENLEAGYRVKLCDESMHPITCSGDKHLWAEALPETPQQIKSFQCHTDCRPQSTLQTQPGERPELATAVIPEPGSCKPWRWCQRIQCSNRESLGVAEGKVLTVESVVKVCTQAVARTDLEAWQILKLDGAHKAGKRTIKVTPLGVRGTVIQSRAHDLATCGVCTFVTSLHVLRATFLALVPRARRTPVPRMALAPLNRDLVRLVPAFEGDPGGKEVERAP